MNLDFLEAGTGSGLLHHSPDPQPARAIDSYGHVDDRHDRRLNGLGIHETGLPGTGHRRPTGCAPDRYAVINAQQPQKVAAGRFGP
jgi:hypothetical protein